jgi:hypothetical protein
MNPVRFLGAERRSSATILLRSSVDMLLHF